MGRLVPGLISVGVWVLALLAVGASPAMAGTCSGVGANTMPGGTTGADGSPLTAPITNWLQVYGQCSPAPTSVRSQVTGSRSLTEYWAHATSCSVSTVSFANDTLTCNSKPDGRFCMYLRTNPAPAGGMTTNVHVEFPDASTFDAAPALGSESTACALTSGSVPPSASGSADLAVTLKVEHLNEEAQRKLHIGDPGKEAALAIFGANATNKGPDSAQDAVLTLRLPDGADQASTYYVNENVGNPARRGSCSQDDGPPVSITCPYPQMQRGQNASIFMFALISKPGSYEASAAIGSPTPDPNLSNNNAELSYTAVSLPDTKSRKIALINTDRAPTFVGSSNTASGRVEISIVRQEGGASASGKKGGKACFWLKGKSASFRRERAEGRCDEPVWLRAAGTRRWKYRMSKPLPRGSYVLYSRAIDKNGLIETGFSARDGNRIEFRVR